MELHKIEELRNWLENARADESANKPANFYELETIIDQLESNHITDEEIMKEALKQSGNVVDRSYFIKGAKWLKSKL